MNKPNILFLDIETRPNLAYVWGKWQQDVIAFEDEWSMISFAAMFEGKQMFCASAEDWTEKAMLHVLRSMLNEADIVVAHNGDEFDVKRINARMLTHGILPPAPYKTVDTLKVLKKYFAFNSNKLGDIGPYLKLGTKHDTGGFALWQGCMKGDAKAWAKMRKYNKQDVLLLRKLYYKLLPWMASHPTYGIYTNSFVCSKCGSKHLQSRGFRHNKTTVVRRFQCQACGGWSAVSGNVQKTKVPTAI